MNRPLRILQVSDFYAPFIGGAEQHVKTLSHHLARRGHQVTVATTRLPATPSEETTDGVTIRRIAGWSSRLLTDRYQRSDAPYHPPIPDPGTVAALKEIIDQLQPEIVHAQGWIAYSCFAAASRRRFRLVVTMHDHGFVCAQRTLMRDGHTLCSGPRLDTCLRCASSHYGKVKGAALVVGFRASRPWHNRVDSWIAISQFVADANRGTLPRDCEISVIPPASTQPPALAQPPSWLPSDGYLLFVGALRRHKGLHWLLEAYSGGHFSRPLVVIGTAGPDTPSTWPTGVIARTNVPHEHVMEAWRHAGIGLMPSMCQEGFGLVAVEAMRSGVPVVASRIGALPEIVADDVTGMLVAPGSISELRAAIRRLDGDPALRQAMGAAGKVQAKRLTPEVVALSHEQLYRRLLTEVTADTLNSAASGGKI
ncbi:MAG: glycosyltransferase family 4 protein [Pseudonocardiaceae bacterium]